LNTFGEKNSRWIQRTRRGKWIGALGDPFASNLESFPWLNLYISMGVERGERGKKGGPSTVWKGVRPGE
jgi:hypothetical protein